MSKKLTEQDPPPLRTAAEAVLANAPLSSVARPAEELLHELQVHKIELEMQNESLRQAQRSLEESRDRYVDLYDLAPVGYLTLSHDVFICEINLTGATLLGEERSKLIHRRFTDFVAPEDSDHWQQHFLRAVMHGGKQQCEVTLLRNDGSRFHARMDCLRQARAGEPPVMRIALTDDTDRKRAEQELHRSEEQFRRLAQISPVGIFHADAQGACTYVNQRWTDITGLSMEESLGDGWMRALHPEDREHTLALWQEAMMTGRSVRMEWRMRRPDGTVYWVLGGAATELDANGQVLGFIGIVNDITERKHTEEELRIAAIAFESQEGMMVTDTNSVILRVNQAFTKLTGYSAEEAVGQTPELLRSGRHDKAFYQQLWRILKEQHYWQGEVWNRRKNGKIYAEWLTISAVTAPDGQTTHYVGTFSDITKNREAEAEIHRLAYYDALTQLPNRRLLQDRLGQALAATTRNGHCGAILFLDLDNFKTLNDTRGHEAGDLLLAEVAQRLHACVRAGDTVARLGGDEFVVLLENLSGEIEEAAAQSKQLGDKVREAIAQPYCLKDCEYHCSASIGVGLFCDNNATIEDLLIHADLAMYQAKDAGRNALRFFDPDMQLTLDRRSAMENDLRQACARQQLRLYYQPQIDSIRGVIGAEALLRWAHLERGLVAPGEFIPLAEETGLILPIGHWVLETACAQIKAWEENSLTRDLRLAINVSARQFRQPDFAAQVKQALKQAGANPTRLKIELTESLVLDNVSDTITKMQVLKVIGVGFSMDDFGTGYSSLSYLKQLPLDQLKIDRSFINDLSADSNDAAIVQAIITMGRTFGLNVIAEGVETEVQRNFLQQYGCHAFQGYLFSRPVPMEEFEQFLKLSTV